MSPLKSQRYLSVSAPVMPPSRSITPDLDGGRLIPHRSKSRNKKFHRIFKQVPLDDRVVNFFSCAFVADILLQGHLYITENFFGFYSNVFGHVTKKLIPVSSVIKITKEKTAKFIPNAVGIVTEHGKFIFGSLLSRETTFRLMYKVWSRHYNQVDRDDEEDYPEIDNDDWGSRADLQVDRGRTWSESAVASCPEDETAVEVSGQYPFIPPRMSTIPTADKVLVKPESKGSSSPDSSTATDCSGLHKDVSTQRIQFCLQKTYGVFPTVGLRRAKNLVLKLMGMPRSTLMLLISTFVSLFLLVSAMVLVYRLNVLQTKMSALDAWNADTDFKGQLFQEVFKWQRRLHDGCVGQVQDSLDTQIHQLAQVRRSIQTLMLVIGPEMQAKNNVNTDHSSSL